MAVKNASFSYEQNPLALIKGSPILITQHSELLSAAYTQTIQLFLSCNPPPLLPLISASWFRGSWQGDHPSLSPPHQTGLPLQAQALCISLPSTVPVLAVLIAEWPCRSWAFSLPPPGQLTALMRSHWSGWMWILVWIPSLIFLTVVGSRHT